MQSVPTPPKAGDQVAPAEDAVSGDKLDHLEDQAPPIPPRSQSSSPQPLPPHPLSPNPHHATVEDADDEDGSLHEHYAQPFPTSKPAGVPVFPNRVPTNFEKLRDNFGLQHQSSWGPFSDDEDWQMAKWIAETIGQKVTDRFLKLKKVRSLLGKVVKSHS